MQTDIHKNIVERCIKGDTKAQYELYKLYAKAMLNISYRMLNNRQDAEDILQEVFTHAFSKIQNFRFESTFGAWIKRITINKCINEIQRRKIDLQFAEDIGIYESPSEPEPDEELFNVEHIRKAMEHLPDGSRMIFSLYLLEGYDHEEISQILNISASTSKTQYMRARQKIKELLISKKYETG